MAGGKLARTFDAAALHVFEGGQQVHYGNAPAHPAVLEVLAEEMAALKFDLRAFVQELALTKTFAQAFDPAPVPQAARAAPAAALPELEAEAARLRTESERLGVAFTGSGEALEEVHHKARPVTGEWKKISAAHGEAQKAAAAATEALQKAVELKRVAADNSRVLREAVEAGAAASLAVPDDKELAAAARTFEEKLVQTTNDEAAAGKEIAGKAAAESLTADAEKARHAAEAAKPAAAEADRQIAAALQKWQEADAVKRPARVAAQQSAQKVREVKAALAFSAAAEAAAPLLDEVERAWAGVKPAGHAMAEMQAMMETADRAEALVRTRAELAAAVSPCAGAVDQHPRG